MFTTVKSSPVWFRVKAEEDFNVALEGLRDHSFNTWSGAGLTDRHSRPLIMVGWRDNPKAYAENKVGMLFSGHLAEELRDRMLEAISAQHVERYKTLGYVWQPKPKEK